MSRLLASARIAPARISAVPFSAPAAASSQRLRSAHRTRSFSSVVVQQHELEFQFPRENHAEGLSYDLNWSLCKYNVIPQGKSFRNLRPADLAKLGPAIKTDAPKVVPWDAELEGELQAYLGSAKITRYVQDSALGTLLANEVHVRCISDTPGAALAFHTLCSRTRGGDVSKFAPPVAVLHASNLGKRGDFIAVSPKSKVGDFKLILMGGSFNASVLVQMLEAASSDYFIKQEVLPLWGPGNATSDVVFLSPGTPVKDSQVKHGFAYSKAGFCRLFMGSAAADGKVVDEYKLLPNSLPLPKSVVMFANDATGTIPAAAKLTPEQAAFYYVAACAPKSVTNLSGAAALVMEMAKSSSFYVVNRGAFENAADADAAAMAAPGSKGSSSGSLNLEVLSVSGATKSPSADAALATAKTFVATVVAKCKGMDAVIQAGPKVE